MSGGARSVLVIDDDPMILRLMETAFTRAGYQVLPALDGDFGLRVAREGPPAVVLLDLMMPRVDGWGFLEALRSDSALRDIPVVILTAHHDQSTDARAERLGVFAVMKKPLNLAELVNQVGRALRSREK